MVFPCKNVSHQISLSQFSMLNYLHLHCSSLLRFNFVNQIQFVSGAASVLIDFIQGSYY